MTHKNKKIPLLVRTKPYLHAYDLGVAAALICSSFELLSIENANTRDQCFIFRFQKGIDAFVEDYWRDWDDEEMLFLPAQYYFEALMHLQHRLRGEDIIH